MYSIIVMLSKSVVAGFGKTSYISPMRNVLSFIIAMYLMLLRLTCRVVVHEGHLPQTPHIMACWHGRLLLAAPLWLKNRPRAFWFFKKARVTMLSSHHKDGVMIANGCKLLGFKVVFGSSSRGGANALRGLKKAAAAGSYLFLTPDGPKGPRHVAKSGVVDAARLTGLPIQPFSASANGKTLKSWDAFLFIRPFSTLHVVFGDPIPAPTKETSAQTLEDLTQTLITLEKKADDYARA